MCCRRRRAGSGRLTGALATVSRASWKSGRLAPSTARATGTPLPSARMLRLVPFLALSVGLAPVFFPPERGLGHAPVHAQPAPVDPFQRVVLQKPALPQAQEEAVGDPLLEAVVGRRAGADLRRVERLPLAAGAQHEEDGVGAVAVRLARPAAAEAVRVGAPADQGLHLRPQSVGDAPALPRG